MRESKGTGLENGSATPAPEAVCQRLKLLQLSTGAFTPRIYQQCSATVDKNALLCGRFQQSLDIALSAPFFWHLPTHSEITKSSQYFVVVVEGMLKLLRSKVELLSPIHMGES